MQNKTNPYLHPDGDLCIPFGSIKRFFYWMNGGQRILDTLDELRADETTKRKYMHVNQLEKEGGER